MMDEIGEMMVALFGNFMQMWIIAEIHRFSDGISNDEYVETLRNLSQDTNDLLMKWATERGNA